MSNPIFGRENGRYKHILSICPEHIVSRNNHRRIEPPTVCELLTTRYA